MFNSVLAASINFFKENSSGRILNRFSKDLGQIDEIIPHAIMDTLQTVFSLIGVVIILVVIDYLFLVPTIIMFIGFWFIRKYYIFTSRSVKRLESASKFE